jgi:hypothetical protein
MHYHSVESELLGQRTRVLVSLHDRSPGSVEGSIDERRHAVLAPEQGEEGVHPLVCAVIVDDLRAH